MGIPYKRRNSAKKQTGCFKAEENAVCKYQDYTANRAPTVYIASGVAVSVCLLYARGSP